MHQSYTMLSGVIPGSGLKGKVHGNPGGDTRVITILCFTVAAVSRLLAGSPPEHGNALPASILMAIPPPDWQGRFPRYHIPE
jgi:hypothetical protein